MLIPRSLLLVLPVTIALATVACQRNEGPAERAGKAIDNAATKAGDQIEKAGDKIKEKVDEAKK